jgi:hypothetical protein
VEEDQADVPAAAAAARAWMGEGGEFAARVREGAEVAREMGEEGGDAGLCPWAQGHP